MCVYFLTHPKSYDMTKKKKKKMSWKKEKVHKSIGKQELLP